MDGSVGSIESQNPISTLAASQDASERSSDLELADNYIEKPRTTSELDESIEPYHIDEEEQPDDQHIYKSVFANDSGEEANWTPPLNVYLSVNDVAISKPAAENASSIQCPEFESLAVTFRVHVNEHNYTLIELKFSAHGHNLEDINAGHLLIWAKDIHSSHARMLDASQTLTHLREYSPDVSTGPAQSYMINIQAKKVGLAIPALITSALRASSVKSSAVVEQIEQLRSSIRAGNESSIKFLIPESSMVNVLELHNLLEVQAKKENETSPLARYFKHSPSVPQYTVGHCPEPGHVDFPNYTSGVRITHYASESQQLLFHMAGSIYDQQLQESYIGQLPSEEFQVIALPLVGFEDRFLCLLDPEGKDELLPKNGDSCLLQFPDIEILEEHQEPHDASPDDESFIRARSSIVKDLNDAIMSLSSNEMFCHSSGASLTRPLTDAEFSELQAQPGEQNWWGRVEMWFSEHKDVVQAVASAPAKDQKEEPPFWHACRVDVSFPQLPPTHQTYLVWFPVDKKAEVEDGERRPLLHTNLNLPAISDGQPLQEIIKGDLDSMHRVKVQRTSSNKTLRAESLAINSLIHPASAQPPTPRRSVQAYRYLLRFDSTEALAYNTDGQEFTNLLEAIPGLGDVVLETGASVPSFLRDRFANTDKATTDALKSLSKIPAGVAFIPGVAGSGKSKMMEDVILYSQFGQGKEPAMKFLYLLNNNDGVDAFAKRLVKTYQTLGITDHPKVLRLYALVTEAKDLERGISGELSTGLEDKDSDDLVSQLVAEDQMSRLSAEVRESHRMQKLRKLTNKNISLHTHALTYFGEHKDEFQNLELLLQAQSEKKDTFDRMELKSEIGRLYRSVLRNFTGTIVTTPVAASVHGFRTEFSPDVVITDEAGTLRELTALVPISFYDPLAWLFVGDPVQKGPYITMEHGQSGKPTTNPSASLLSYSTLARAVDSGETCAHLSANHRSHGNLLVLPNKLCYSRSMFPGKTKSEDMWPNAVDQMIRYLQTINPKQNNRDCRLLVEFPNARTAKLSRSTINMAHVHWVLSQVQCIVNEWDLQGLGKNANNPADILILSYYKAQSTVYSQEMHRLMDEKKLPRNVLDRVKIRTLDNAQGDEADITFGDLVQVSQPGFTGDMARATLVTTRARGISILILNRGMFVGWESDDAWNRAKILYRMWDLSTNSMIRLETCTCCQRQGHDEEQCGQDSDQADLECEIRVCNESGHRTDDCPRRVCRNCQEEGHSANECQGKLTCSRCTQTDHLAFTCTSPPQCGNCGDAGHTTRTCRKCKHCQANHPSNSCARMRKSTNMECRNCGEMGHIRADCPKKICKRCSSQEHVVENCPLPAGYNRQCNECGQMGHMARQCPSRKCRKCNQPGHTGEQCDVPFCHYCHSSGHTSKECDSIPLKCRYCGGKHYAKFCPENPSKHVHKQVPKTFATDWKERNVNVEVSELQQKLGKVLKCHTPIVEFTDNTQMEVATNEITDTHWEVATDDLADTQWGGATDGDTTHWGVATGGAADTQWGGGTDIAGANITQEGTHW